MKFTISIDQKTSIEWDLSMNQAFVYAFLYTIPSWAKSTNHNDKTYYFASKNMAIKEIPMVTNKLDTMYRIYKSLVEIGLIDLIKIDGKDYIMLTEKSKEWNSFSSDQSDTHPIPLGCSSENHSDTHPTYKTTILDKTTKKRDVLFIDWFNDSMIKLKGKKGSFKLIKPVEKSFRARLADGYDFNDFQKALKNITNDSYHKENNYQYLTPEFICRPTILEKWCNTEHKKDKPVIENWGS